MFIALFMFGDGDYVGAVRVSTLTLVLRNCLFSLTGVKNTVNIKPNLVFQHTQLNDFYLKLM